MSFWKEAIKLENLFLEYLEKDMFEEFNKHIKEREEFYNRHASEDSSEVAKFLNSNEYKEINKKVNDLYELKKDAIKKEIKELALSHKAAQEYRNNSFNGISYFSKKV
ncbi:hypothetical protein [Clostridium paridis]|uniref:Uncharacterized protein n=1 Tax=Clostridium paridis TaxID=2803863 RepID=A0A937K5E0_9CLOT|nr:hypothetical protein [Clostridium paridis]MBL4932909.1 hypothetical protein [Clostridium paridis]